MNVTYLTKKNVDSTFFILQIYYVDFQQSLKFVWGHILHMEGPLLVYANSLTHFAASLGKTVQYWITIVQLLSIPNYQDITYLWYYRCLLLCVCAQCHKSFVSHFMVLHFLVIQVEACFVFISLYDNADVLLI